MKYEHGTRKTNDGFQQPLLTSTLDQGDNLMEYSIRPISNEDCEGIMDIFNYYIELWQWEKGRPSKIFH